MPRAPAEPPENAPPRVSRRALLRGAVAGGAVVVAGGGLAGCAGDEPADSDTGGPAKTGEVLVTTGEVPEGGGIVLSDDQVVVTQPQPGAFKGFSSICTHEGCEVTGVADGTINCACHGSQFSIDDGSVVTGPATAPLPSVAVTVKGASVVLT